MRSDESRSTGRIKNFEKIETPDMLDDGIVVYEAEDEDEILVYVLGQEISEEEQENFNKHRLLPDGEVRLDVVEWHKFEKVREESSNLEKKRSVDETSKFNEKREFDVNEFVEWTHFCRDNIVG